MDDRTIGTGRGLFVTGTDTGVGKSVVAAGLTRLARNHGVNAVAIKPIETGCAVQNGILYPEDGALLREAAQLQLGLEQCAPLRFMLPSSPARAATAEGRFISLEEIESHVRGIAATADLTIVEGAGGLMVPIHGNLMMIDLIERLGFPTLLVARTRLGTINHTLLSVHALRSRRLRIAGIVLSAAVSEAGPEEAYTPDDIAGLTNGIPVAVLPCIEPEARQDPEAMARIIQSEVQVDVWKSWICG